MRNKRIIPVLQLHDQKLVKTRGFRNPTYIGDPLNAISIFNDLDVDEIILNQITLDNRIEVPNFRLLELISSKSLAPISYGGGISNIDEARRIIDFGYEKLVFNSAFFTNPRLLNDCISVLGSQAIVISIDVVSEKGNYSFVSQGGSIRLNHSFEDICKELRDLNPGEILINNVSRDGHRIGYDFEIINKFKAELSQPIIALGGASNRKDLFELFQSTNVDAAAASSIFLFKSNRQNQLINYPSATDKLDLIPGYESYLDIGAFMTYGKSITVEKNKLFPESKMCKTCIITEDVPGSGLDLSSECNYCKLHRKLEREYPNSSIGNERFHSFLAKIKEDGRDKKYDCILGISGGADSSYLAHILVENGIRPLAVHFDNTWNSPIATDNIYKITTLLNIDLETYVVDNSEYDDIYRSFMLAGVKDLEAPTDIGFMGVLYRAAEKHKIKHIIEGHSFRTEGVSPLGWLYMDGGYVKSVHKKYGKLPMKTYPNMTFIKFVKWASISNIQRTRPLYWLDYNKNTARELLKEKYGWKWYGGHHLENRFTAFYHSFFLPSRFGIDFRQIEFSALIRSGFIKRAHALSTFYAPREVSSSLLELVQQRLNFTAEQFEYYMKMPHKKYTDFGNYKSKFKIFKPFFYVLLKMNRIPLSFYEKFCK